MSRRAKRVTSSLAKIDSHCLKLASTQQHLTPSLATGIAGQVIYHWVAERQKLSQNLLRQAVELEMQRHTTLDFFDGTPGLIAAAGLLQEKSKKLSDRYRELNRWKAVYIRNHGRSELIFGMTGLGIADQLWNDRKAYLTTLDYLESLQTTRFGTFWCGPKDVLKIGSSFEPAKQIRMSIAHGGYGPLLFLSNAVLANGKAKREKALLKKASAAAVDACKSFRDKPIQPTTLASDKRKNPMTGWCYGEASVGFALAICGVALKDKSIQQFGLELFEKGVSPRRLSLAPAKSFSLCHGWSGLALMAYRLGKRMDLPSLTAKSHELLDLAFTSYNKKPREDNDPKGQTLLYGPAGLACAAKTIFEESSAPWDFFLLTSPIPKP